MPIDNDIRVEDGTGIAAQWLGNLLAPVAFLIELEVAYMLVPRACDTGNLLPVHLAHTGALLLALGGTFFAWREWRTWVIARRTDMAEHAARSRFMAKVGLLASGGFVLVILALWLPSLFLDPC
jgi:hypothetical protein